MGRGRARFRTGYLSSASFSLRNFSRVFSFSGKSYGLTTGRQGFSGGGRVGNRGNLPAWAVFGLRLPGTFMARPHGAVFVGGVRSLRGCAPPTHISPYPRLAP